MKDTHIRFVLLFLFLIVITNAAVVVSPDAALSPLVDLTGRLVVVFSKALGLASGWDGSLVAVSGFKMRINLECTAIQFFAIFVSGVLAYPGRGWGIKLLGIFIGGLFLAFANILRIVILGVVGANFDPRIFGFIHMYLWQSLYAILVFFAWHVWASGRFKEGPAAAFFIKTFFASAFFYALISLLVGPYIKALAVFSGVFFEDVSYWAPMKEIVFRQGARKAFFPVSVDVFDSIIFYALIVSSAGPKEATALLKRLLAGTLALSAIHISFVLTAGGLFAWEAAEETVRTVLWALRGISILAPLLLWYVLRGRFSLLSPAQNRIISI